MAKRRTHGDGNVKKLPSGNWRGQIMDGYREERKRKLISFTAKTKGEVLEKIRHYWQHKDDPPAPVVVKTPSPNGPTVGMPTTRPRSSPPPTVIISTR